MWALGPPNTSEVGAADTAATGPYEKASGESLMTGSDEDEFRSQVKPVVRKRGLEEARRKAVALVSDILTWRNLVVAPVTEEFVFRACIGEILRQGGFSTKHAVLICPVFFAVAHLHHFWDLVYYQRQPIVLAVLTLVLQMTYTTLFGWYAAFLLVRTGHLLCPIVAHVFCNVMGFPDLGAIPRHPHRRVVSAAFVLGVAAFASLVRNSTLLSLLFDRDVRNAKSAYGSS
ncbi:CAAX prenyl protease [Klebsormidium nitens]|uniref:intramembrane prenyl-peptidase Rce1 n=1 Tax=Klebsormidium nitens TaxID=105231 RepID=A0A0U9HJB4_KLENI|nr:CAAX prenyl protease [Klebsormidium nitens]|eukprot:GAQ81759.1 CAAX prenyl protease [Klebsormidium nitens]